MTHHSIIEAMVASIHKAGDFNKNVETPPTAILWTDEPRAWESLLPDLRDLMPNLLTLGEWNAELRQGPSSWVRCAIANTLPDVQWPAGQVPVVYLPGVSRARLREVSCCPVALRPIVELQFRGAYWSQANSKDWTPVAFLGSSHGGLAFDVAADHATKAALASALPEVFAESVVRLSSERVTADAIARFLEVDVHRDILKWMNDPAAAKASWSSAVWGELCRLCVVTLKTDPSKEDPLSVAARLAKRDGEWHAVWNRFKETPSKFKRVVELLSQLPEQPALFGDLEPYVRLNDSAEDALRDALLAIGSLNHIDEARARIQPLESEHGLRRGWVWAEFGRSNMAAALGHLVDVVRLTQKALTGSDPEAMRLQYEQQAWEVDAAMIDALAAVHDQASARAVEAALAVLYKPWLNQHAEQFQGAVKAHGYPLVMPTKEEAAESGLVVFFVDGLRYDAGQRLSKLLTAEGHKVAMTSQWTAVPSVTASGKVLVSPAAVMATGEPDSSDFEPVHKVKRQPLNAPRLRQTLADMGWQILLDRSDVGNPTGKAWCESGDIDTYGHSNGLRLAHDLNHQVQQVQERIDQLIKAGWKRVRVVTDHGWLLVPGKLDKVHIEKDMTETTWGRAAKLKPSALAQVVTLPWSWCHEVNIAMAPGAKSFKAGEHYAHGGLSLQESLTPILEIESNQVTLQSAKIKSARWVGMRLKIEVEGAGRFWVDLRTKASDRDSSIVEAEEVKDGVAALVVQDPDREGDSAVLVVVDNNGNVLAKSKQIIGTND